MIETTIFFCGLFAFLMMALGLFLTVFEFRYGEIRWQQSLQRSRPAPKASPRSERGSSGEPEPAAFATRL